MTPAVPGLNVQGDYWRDYRRDPMTWVKSELGICRNWHHLFMPMVAADPKFCHDNKKDDRRWRARSLGRGGHG